MKKVFPLIAFMFCATLTYAQTADDIINKYIDAIGGKDKLTTLKNMYVEGSIDANGQKIPVKIWIVNKTAFRFQGDFNGMTIYNIITKDSGWAYNPFSGQKQAEPMTSDEVKSSQPQLDLAGTLFNYKEKGYKVELEGQDDVDGTQAYKIEERINDSLSTTYYIDPDSYYVLRSESKSKVNGKQVDEKTDFSNYQKTPDGYVFPMDINNDGGEIKVTTIKINTDIDSKLFTPSKS